MTNDLDLRGLLRGAVQVFRDRRFLRRVYLYPGPIPAAFRERIMLAASQSSGCAVCESLHEEWAVFTGNDKERLRCLTSADLSECEEKWLATEEMSAVVRLIGYGNDCGNAFHSLVSRFTGSPRRVSTDEWILFAILAPPVVAACFAGFFLGVVNRIRQVVTSSQRCAVDVGEAARHCLGEE